MSPWTHYLVVIYSYALHSLYAFDVTDGDIQKCYSNMKYMKEFICLESPTIFYMLKPLGSDIRTLNHNLGKRNQGKEQHYSWKRAGEQAGAPPRHRV